MARLFIPGGSTLAQILRARGNLPSSPSTLDGFYRHDWVFDPNHSFADLADGLKYFWWFRREKLRSEYAILSANAEKYDAEDKVSGTGYSYNPASGLYVSGSLNYLTFSTGDLISSNTDKAGGSLFVNPASISTNQRLFAWRSNELMNAGGKYGMDGTAFSNNITIQYGWQAVAVQYNGDGVWRGKHASLTGGTDQGYMGYRNSLYPTSLPVNYQRIGWDAANLTPTATAIAVIDYAGIASINDLPMAVAELPLKRDTSKTYFVMPAAVAANEAAAVPTIDSITMSNVQQTTATATVAVTIPT